MIRSAALLVLALSATALAPPVLASDDCIRVQQVRAFSVDSDRTLVVRQGPSRFHRVTLPEDCPLESADRLGFVQGNSQFYVIGQGSRHIPANTSSLQTRFCTATPHAYVSIIENNKDRRTRCPILSIEASSQEAFQAGQVRDNRY